MNMRYSVFLPIKQYFQTRVSQKLQLNWAYVINICVPRVIQRTSKNNEKNKYNGKRVYEHGSLGSGQTFLRECRFPSTPHTDVMLIIV